MKIEIKIPSAGESVTEAVIARILKSSGPVEKNEEILEIETDKVNQVVVAPESGALTLSVSQDQKVKIGEVVGYVDTQAAAVAPSIKPAAPIKKEEITSTPASTGARVFEEKAEPTPKEVKESPKEVKKESISGKRVKMTGLRKTIAQRLVSVKNTTAMLTTFNEVDMSKVMEIRSEEKEAFEKKYGVKLGFLSFFVRACSSALQAFPEVNAFIDGDDIVFNEDHHIGIAVSTEKGLMVPVLKRCQNLTFSQIESSVASFAKKAREGKISIEDLQGGTFTITNGGVFGSLLSTPILNPPQSAILGMHKILPRAVVVDNSIVIRPMMYLALSYDHRIIDGKEAVGFLVHVKESLENPAKLLLES